MPADPSLARSDAQVHRIFSEHQPMVLIIGAAGQIGVELAQHLLTLLKPERLTLADIGRGVERLHSLPSLAPARKTAADVTDFPTLASLIAELAPDIVIDLAAMLSNQMKDQPLLGFDINFGGPYNLLKALHSLRAAGREPILFVPSSIAATGVVGLPPSEAAGIAAQNTVYTAHAGNRYGQTKASIEGIMGAMSQALGIKAIAPRWPIIASPTKLVGMGATDYVVQITRSALRGEPYACPVAPDKHLPLLTGRDMVRTVLYPLARALETPFDQMREKMLHAYHYNVPGVSLSPRELRDGLLSVLPPALRPRVNTTFDAANPINILLNVYFERTEGDAIRRDCFDFHLEHDTLEKFAGYVLDAYLANPETLLLPDDSPVKQADIRACCAAAKARPLPAGAASAF
jgi:nucleoside-diphosphate-sugar epimerase